MMNRLEERNKVKAELASATEASEKLRLVRRRLSELDRQLDDAADQHRATVKPLREQIEEIEERVLAATKEGKSTAELDQQREQLLEQIDAAGEALREQVSKLKERKKPLAREAKTLEPIASQRLALENSLTNERLGNPDLLARYWAINKLATLVGADVHAFSRRQSTLGFNPCRVSQGHYYALAAQRGGEIVAQLQGEAAEIRRQLIEE